MGHRLVCRAAMICRRRDGSGLTGIGDTAAVPTSRGCGRGARGPDRVRSAVAASRGRGPQVGAHRVDPGAADRQVDQIHAGPEVHDLREAISTLASLAAHCDAHFGLGVGDEVSAEVECVTLRSSGELEWCLVVGGDG